MEFLRTFEEAKELGITKEEFMTIWEQELKSNKRGEHSRMVLQSKDNSYNQSEINDCKMSGVEFPSQWQLIKDEIWQNVQVKLQLMFNELIEKHNQQWKLLGQKYDQLQNELHSHFQVLINHISNTSEILTSSLKLFILKEINLLEQDLKKIIACEPAGQETAFTVYHDPYREANDLCEEITTSYFETKNLDLPHNVHDKPKVGNYKQMKKQLPEPAFDEMIEEYRPLSSKGLQSADLDNSRRHCDTVEDTHQKQPSKSNTKSSKASAGSKIDYNAETKTSKSNVSVKSSSTNSSIQLDDSSIKGIGLYDEAISKQMKETLLTNSAKSGYGITQKDCDNVTRKKVNKVHSLDDASSVKSDSTTSHGKSDDLSVIKQLPAGYVSFTIFSIETFSKMRASYMTPFYYTSSQASKVRFHLKFNANCQLSVQFLVSNGKFNSSVAWPISFNGAGFIYNETSRKSTHIWTLGPLQCNKPEPGQESKFTAAVSLRTLRSIMPDVTYQVICNKGYAMYDRLSFEWNLNACENFDK